MFDLGWQELILIAIVAIVVISPKDLPHAIRAVTQFARQLRSLSREFRSGVSELVREVELDDLKRQIDKAGSLDQLNDLTSGTDPTASLTEDFDPRQFARELKRRVNPDAPLTGDGANARVQGQADSAVLPSADRADGHEEAHGGADPASAPIEKSTSG